MTFLIHIGFHCTDYLDGFRMRGYKDKNKKFHPIRKSRSPSKMRKKKFENAKIQSLIFNKKKFSITEAKEWADDHGFTARKVEPTKNTLRIRQFSPNKIKKGTECKTIQFGGSGVQGVLCDTPERLRRYAKGGKLSTSLGAIISPEKKPPAKLLKEINADLNFRDELIDKNKELKVEIKADPESTFAKADAEEFKENAKEIREVAKTIKRAFKDIPKEERENIDRETINRLRVLR